MNEFAVVSEYIKSSWLKSVRKRDNRKDFVLPFDFVPPCVDGDLTDLYYWDTYFTNKGLILDGLDNYAFNNIKNLEFCLDRFGCVPNMCRSNGADYASQPPLLVFMIDDYYEFSKDEEFLADGFIRLEKEYAFWESKRKLDNGLNRYGTNKLDYGDPSKAISEYVKRCNADLTGYSEGQIISLIVSKTAEGESGEDHTPRFKNRAADIAPIDLNSYLCGFERFMAKFSRILKNGKETLWQKRADDRLILIKKYCYDEDSGIYYDYDTTIGEKTFVVCSACYVPFSLGIDGESRGVEKINQTLMLEYGVTSCEKIDTKGEVFQWGYPNMWAPHNYWAYVANKRVGLTARAEEVRLKYLSTVSRVFNKTNNLYEKYDATTGDKTTFNEYGLPEMLGWTAGVFQVFFKG